jgi:hypothetical protein
MEVFEELINQGTDRLIAKDVDDAMSKSEMNFNDDFYFYLKNKRFSI